MDSAEVMYRALLARLYVDHLIHDVNDVIVIFDETSSCAAMASAIVALMWARGKSARAVSSSELEDPVDNALLLLSPYVEGLGERAKGLLPKVRKFIALHTPVYYHLELSPELEEAAKTKEVRFAVRETPGEIAFYRATPAPVLYHRRALASEELSIVRRYEASKAKP